jgi:quinol monooxygenase YgiN
MLQAGMRYAHASGRGNVLLRAREELPLKPFTIIVEFIVRPEHIEAFMPLMVANARTSRETEPGCERFDVLLPEGDAGRILLYEIYADRAAFDAHCSSAHFIAFDRATRDMISGKTVTICKTL